MRVIAAAVALVLVVAAAPASASDVALADLLATPEEYDGMEITLNGELVGDFQRRGDSVWVQLNDDPYALAPLHDGGSLSGSNVGVAVRFPTALFDAAGLAKPGGYRIRGPVVTVTGEWRFHDADRGGETYLSARSLEVVARERPIEEGGDWAVFFIGLALIGLGLAPVLMRRRRRPAGE